MLADLQETHDVLHNTKTCLDSLISYAQRTNGRCARSTRFHVPFTLIANSRAISASPALTPPGIQREIWDSFATCASRPAEDEPSLLLPGFPFWPPQDVRRVCRSTKRLPCSRRRAWPFAL